MSDFFSLLASISPSSKEYDRQCLSVLKSIVEGNLTTSAESVRLLEDVSLKTSKRLNLFLVGRILYEDSLNVYLRGFLSVPKSLDIQGVTVMFDGSSGMWKFFGLCRAALDSGCIIRENFLRHMFLESPLSCDPIFLAFFADLIRDSRNNWDAVVIEDFAIHCCIYHCDFLVSRIRELLRDLENRADVIARLNDHRSLFSKKFDKMLASFHSPSKEGLAGATATSLLDDWLQAIFFSHPADRQRVVKVLAPKVKKLSRHHVESIYELLMPSSSFGSQYIFLNALAVEHKDILMEICRLSSFAEIRVQALNYLLDQQATATSNLSQCFAELCSDLNVFLPSHLEGETNLMVLRCMPLADFNTSFLAPFATMLDNFEALIDRDVASICDGHFLACLTLSNKLLRRHVNNVGDAAAESTLERIASKLTFLVTCQSPEGEEFDDVFHLDIENKAKVIGHFAWKLIKEISWAFASLASHRNSCEHALSVCKGWLLDSRHKGAICALQAPFRVLLDVHFSGISQESRLQFARNVLSECLSFKSIDSARRSAGIPLVIDTIVTCLDGISRASFIEYVIMSNLAHTSSDERAIHNANILRELVKNSELFDDIVMFIPDAIRYSFDLLRSPNWKVRNAASLLTGASLQFVISECQTKRGTEHLDYKVLSARFPRLVALICEVGLLHEASHIPCLVLLKNLRFRADVDDRFLCTLIDFFRQQSTHTNFYVRTLATTILNRNLRESPDIMLGVSTNAHHSGVQSVLENVLLADCLEYLQQHPLNHQVLSKALALQASLSELSMYRLCDQYLTTGTPVDVRHLVASKFASWILEQPEVPVTSKLLIHARFCIADESGQIREPFCAQWLRHRQLACEGNSEYQALCDIYMLVASRLSKAEFSKFVQKVFVEPILAEHRSSPQRRVLFAHEPLNLNENLLLELELLLRQSSVDFDIPLELQPVINSCDSKLAIFEKPWHLRCVQRLVTAFHPK